MPRPIIPARLPTERSSRPISMRNANEIGRIRTSATNEAMTTITPTAPKAMAARMSAGLGSSGGITAHVVAALFEDNSSFLDQAAPEREVRPVGGQQFFGCRAVYRVGIALHFRDDVLAAQRCSDLLVEAV